MTPIKLAEFLSQTRAQKEVRVMNLAKLGLFHAAPVENGKPLLALQFDRETGTLMPAS